MREAVASFPIANGGFRMTHLAYMAQLDVDLKEFTDGLRTLARTVKPAKAGEAILRFEDGQLVIRVGGGEIAIAATGRWSGEARVNGALVLAIAKHPPEKDPLTLRVEAGRLCLASLSVPCEWQETGTAKLEIPIETPFIEILRIGINNTDEALKQSGILLPVHDARRRCEALIKRAANALRPLGIQPGDVKRMVDDHIRQVP
jgi:hypothetical protein